MTNALKLAHVTATFPPYHGGTGSVCYYNARELARRGHNVHVFTAKVYGAPEEEILESVHVHRLQPIVRVGNAPLLPQLPTSLGNFDVIHLHYPFIAGAEMVRLASLVHHVPFVITHHNDLIGDGARARLFATYQQASARVTVRHARYVCAVSIDHYLSSRLYASLNGKGPKAVEVPNGVDVTHFAPQGTSDVRNRYHIPCEANLVLFVAAIDRAHHFKGLDRLLQAMSSLSCDAWLLIVGDGDMRAAYQQLAKSLGMDQRTIFAGAIDHDHLPPFYRAADVTVLPSSPPESFGLVLVESMACGTPVVASNIPGVRTVVSEGVDGFLVEANNVEALSGCLSQFLMMSVTQRRAMGQAGRRKVEERYAWEQIGFRLETLYCDALEKPASTANAVSAGCLEKSGEN